MAHQKKLINTFVDMNVSGRVELEMMDSEVDAKSK
jgi:hypothetical protein